MDDEFVRLTAVSAPGEAEAQFSARLSEFWTHMLRDFQEDFEKVYAETVEFETAGDRLERHYLCEESVVELVAREMDSWGIEHPPVDWDDRWNRYEAVAGEWMQIEH